jgi:hypothetical protein
MVVIAACSTPRPADVRSSPATPSLFDQAVAYERGHGVPRDFRKAGALYDRLCRDGGGDLRACAKLLEVDVRLHTDRSRASIMQRMCERGDKLGCFLGLPGGNEDETVLRARGVDLDALPTQCAAGDLSACRFLFAAAGLASLVSSSHGITPTMVDIARVSLDADRDLVFDLTAESCWAVVQAICDSKNSDESRDGPACLDDIEADRKELGPSARGLGVARACQTALARACSAGSVVACEHFKGRRITSCVRCDAGDKRACGFSDIGDCRAPKPDTAPASSASPACRDNPLAKDC